MPFFVNYIVGCCFVEPFKDVLVLSCKAYVAQGTLTKGEGSARLTSLKLLVL